MKIRQIDIHSLFGYFNHEIPLKENDRITIIHGPNGVGKTTVLRLVHDLFKRRFHSLFITPFDRIVVRFAPKGTLTVRHIKKEGTKDSAKLELTYCCEKQLVEHTVFSRVPERLKRYSSSLLERMIDHIERIGPSEWYDEITDEIMAFDEVVFRYGHFLPSDIRESIPSLSDEMDNVLNQINIVVIETQRLFTRHKNGESVPRYRREVPVQRVTVEQYSKDMVLKIKECQRESGEIGSSLDSSFPQRLLEAQHPPLATKENIQEEYTRQSEYRDRLMKAGLLTAKISVPLTPEGLEENERKILWAYLDDVQKKLDVFDSLLRRVELFKEIINSRFSYKKFEIDKDRGFVFKSDRDNSVVPPTALSSGEQHEIVLTYGLLFRAPAKSLILIDEPELSLHVTWQSQFLEDIARISELADLDFLVATHSPFIIHDRRDLMVKLAGTEEG